MNFENACNCIVDYDVLEKAIIEECKRRNIEPKEEYKIYMYRGYAGISMKHDKVSVHRIIGKYMVGYDFESEIVVHHIDGNKLNNSINNLQILKNNLHTKEHDLVSFVDKDKLRENVKKATEAIKRKDVSEEKVKELREEGFTVKQIAEALNCGINTVNRRLGMKDY